MHVIEPTQRLLNVIILVVAYVQETYMVFIRVGDPDPVPYDRKFSGLPSPHPLSGVKMSRIPNTGFHSFPSQSTLFSKDVGS
jgi:hypothetical protein